MFYTFEKPPVFFEQAQLSQIQPVEEYGPLANRYDAAFEERRQAARQLRAAGFVHAKPVARSTESTATSHDAGTPDSGRAMPPDTQELTEDAYLVTSFNSTIRLWMGVVPVFTILCLTGPL